MVITLYLGLYLQYGGKLSKSECMGMWLYLFYQWYAYVFASRTQAQLKMTCFFSDLYDELKVLSKFMLSGFYIIAAFPRWSIRVNALSSEGICCNVIPTVQDSILDNVAMFYDQASWWSNDAHRCASFSGEIRPQNESIVVNKSWISLSGERVTTFNIHGNDFSDAIFLHLHGVNKSIASV